MSKRALLVVREVSGIAALAETLVKEFGFELCANSVAGDALASRGLPFDLVEDFGAELLSDAESGLSLVVANFADVESTGRSFMSWKSALKAFDRRIVETIRSAAWTVNRVAVVGNPGDYETALDELRGNGGKFRQSFRIERATAALRATSEFDFAVAQYLEVQGAEAPDMGALSGYSKAMRFSWPRSELLDSGENRHQLAAVYGSFFEQFKQASGPRLSYDGVLSVSRAAYLIGEFEKPASALIRNGKVVTAGCGQNLDTVLEMISRHDDVRDSWLVVNGRIGESLLESILKSGVAGVLAPDFSEREIELFKSYASVVGMTSVGGMGYESLQEIRSVAGGVLVQDKDRAAINPMEWTVLSLAQPLVEDWESLVFGAKVVRHADSASLVIVSEERIVSIATGHYTSKRAWQAIEQSGIGLTNTAAIFDSPDLEPSLLEKMKNLGVRVVLVPFSGEETPLREAANEIGLVLLGTSKGLRRL